MTGMTQPNGIGPATALRAQYAEILEHAGAVELAGWCQGAIDSADIVLMDAVIRENDSRRKDERAFLSPGVLELFGNVWQEHRLAQAVLNEVVTTAHRGGVALSKFEGGNGTVGLQRIALGLRLANSDYTLDENGGIVLSQHPDHSARLEAVGTAMRKMAAKP